MWIFRFDVEAIELLTVTISWDSAPLEVEQSNVILNFGAKMDGRKVSQRYAPNMKGILWLTMFDGWSPVKENIPLLTGMNERYQTYGFTGSKTIMGVGSTSPEEFTGDATWDTGSSQVGRPNLRVNRMVLG